MTDTVRLELTKQEAIVLFELLSRYSNTDVLNIEDQAEQRALWNVCCLLESVLAEPFHPSYGEILSDVRDALRDAAD
jgi:hypothetical protein